MIDLRCCAYPMSGTQVQALQLVRALSRLDEADVAVLLPDVIHHSVGREVSNLPSNICRHTVASLPRRRPHVFHCPHQLLVDQQIGEAVALGHRLVITQQDMIMSHTPSYFHNRNEWQRYVEMVDTSFLIADHVAFFAPHAMADALSEGVLSPERASVVPLGTDHLTGSESGHLDLPSARRLADGGPFLLVIGNAYLHKNRTYALHIFANLRRDGHWKGRLVFAGGHPTVGGSRLLERQHLEAHPREAKSVVDLGPVSEEVKAWLYDHAALVLYPSLYEGFGLVPFEAAAFGTPVAYSLRSALGDFLPAAGALMEGWNANETSARIADVLANPQRGQDIVEAIRKAGRNLTWERTAQRYLEIYREVVRRPPGAALAFGGIAIGPAVASLTEGERRMLKAYRRSSRMAFALDSTVSLATAGMRWKKRQSARWRIRHVK